MKKLLFGVLLFFCALPSLAQDYVALKRETFTAVANGAVVRLVGTAASFHKVTWNKIGTVTVCSLKVEQSATGTGGWSDLITTQDCSVNGTTSVVAATPNYIRTITHTTFTGTGSVVSVYTGYINDPAGATTVPWSGITNPTASRSLTMGVYTSTYTHATATGAPACVWCFTDTWNNAAFGGPFWKVNITDTASAAAALLFDWQVGGVSKFSVDKTGAAIFAGPITVGGTAGPITLTNIAAPTPPASGKTSLYPDSTRKVYSSMNADGLAGTHPRVLYMTNCTTEGNCTTTNEVDADVGQQGTTETNFASNWSMPANFLFTNKGIRACATFELTSSASPPTLLLKLKAGSTALVATTAATVQGSLSGYGFSACWIVQGTAAAGASVSVEANPEGPMVIDLAGPSWKLMNTVNQPVTGVATNGALTIQISAQWGTATTGNTVQLHQFYVMELY